MTTLHNVKEFAETVFQIGDDPGLDDVSVLEFCEKYLFKATEWGLGLVPILAGPRMVVGIKVTGIVEGTEIEASSEPLMFPFALSAFDKACDAVSIDLDNANAERNDRADDAAAAAPSPTSIRALALEAGFKESNQPKVHILGGPDDDLPELARFAALVVADMKAEEVRRAGGKRSGGGIDSVGLVEPQATMKDKD